MVRTIAIAFALATAIPCSASATTWHINAEGTGDAPTIQAGIDSSAVGDTVELACGTALGLALSRDLLHGRDAEHVAFQDAREAVGSENQVEALVPGDVHEFERDGQSLDHGIENEVQA